MDIQAFILTHYSIEFWGAVLIILLVILQLILDRVFARFKAHMAHLSFLEEIMNIMQGISIFFAILFAVFTYFLLNNYLMVTHHVKQELGNIGNTWKISLLLPKQNAMPIIQGIYRYVEEVIENEMDINSLVNPKAASSLYLGWDLLEEMGQTIQRQDINPLLKSRLLKNVSNIGDFRRYRLNDQSLKLPLHLWVVVFLGMILMMVCLSITNCHDKQFSFIYSFLFLAMLGALITLMIFLDRPFLGDFAWTTKMYERRIDNMLVRLGPETIEQFKKERWS